MAKQKDRKEAAKEFLGEVLSLVPEAQRAAVQAALEADPVLDRLGDGVLRQSDHTRLAQEAQKEKEAAAAAKAVAEAEGVKFQTERQKVTEWYQGELAKAGAPAPGDGGGATTALDPANFVSKAELAKIVAAAQNQASGNMFAWVKTLVPLAMRHKEHYKQELDFDALVQHAQKINLPVDRAYEDFSKDLRAEADKERAKEAELNLRRKIEAEVRAEMTPLPFTVAAVEPTSTLQGLVESKPSTGVDAAIAEWNRMQAERR